MNLGSWEIYGFAFVIWGIIAALAPRQAAWFVVLWIPVQGWVQLNLLDDSNSTVLIYEYLIVGLYLVFAIKALKFPKTFGPPSILAFAVPFVVWTILLIPSSIVHGGLVLTMIGLRTYLLPLPLVWIGYHAFRNRAELENVGTILFIEMSIIGLLAAFQFANLVTSWGSVIEVPTGYAAVGTLRPPGTFSSPAHLGMYIVAMVPLAIGFLGLHTTWLRRISYAMGLAGAVLALIINSQRSAVVLLCVCIPVLLMLSRKVTAPKSLVLSLCMAIVGATFGLSVVEGAFTERVRSITDDANYALLVAPVERMTDALQEALTGGGLGSASPGVARLDLPSTKSAESFMAALVYQLGLPGLLSFFLYVAALAIGGFRALQKCRRQDVGLLAAAILVYELAIVLQSWTYDPLHYPPTRVIFWFWAGVLISLPRIAQPHRLAVPRPLSTTKIAAPTDRGRAVYLRTAGGAGTR